MGRIQSAWRCYTRLDIVSLSLLCVASVLPSLWPCNAKFSIPSGTRAEAVRRTYQYANRETSDVATDGYHNHVSCFACFDCCVGDSIKEDKTWKTTQTLAGKQFRSRFAN